MDACKADAFCAGVYDQGCDAEAGDIFLCGLGNFAFSGTSCIYKPQSPGLPTFHDTKYIYFVIYKILVY